MISIYLYDLRDPDGLVSRFQCVLIREISRVSRRRIQRKIGSEWALWMGPFLSPCLQVNVGDGVVLEEIRYISCLLHVFTSDILDRKPRQSRRNLLSLAREIVFQHPGLWSRFPLLAYLCRQQSMVQCVLTPPLCTTETPPAKKTVCRNTQN